MCQQAAQNRFSCPSLTECGHVENENNEKLCIELVEEMSNRERVIELEQDHNPSTTMCVYFLSKFHGIFFTSDSWEEMIY